MVAVVPELGPGNWVTDPMKTLDLIIAQAFETDQSQSNIYNTAITSIAFIIAQYQHSPSKLTDEIKISLNKLLTRYFDAADIQVDYVNSTEDNTYALLLSVEVKRGGRSYNLSRTAVLNDGRIIEVLKEINK